MSDRATIEVKWHELLSKLSLEILPEVRENLDAMTEADKLATESMCSFFCYQHSFVQMAEVSQKALSVVEDGHFSHGSKPCAETISMFDKSNDPGTIHN